MHCKTCNNQVSPEAIMCTKCGVPPLKGKLFCNNCGSDTNEHAIICLKCGISLEQRKISISDNVELKQALYNPTFWAALIIMVAFFLPWLDLIVIQISGWHLRDLVRYLRAFEDEGFKPNGLVNMMYLLPIFSILIIIGLFSKNEFIKKRERTLKIVTGLYPLAFIATILLSSELTNPLDFWCYGFYITLAAGLYLLYDGVFLSKTKKIIYNTPPPISENVSYITQPPSYSSNNIIETAEQKQQLAEYINQFPEKKNRSILYAIISLVLVVIGFWVYIYFKNENRTEETTAVNSETKPVSTIVNNDAQNLNTTKQTTQENKVESNVNSVQTNLIRKYILAEDNREFSTIEEMLIIPMDKYFDLNSPGIEQIKNRYEHLWGITSHCKTIITNIQNVDDNVYLVDYDYEYFGNKTKTFNQQKNKKMFYRFNYDNKIESIYE